MISLKMTIMLAIPGIDDPFVLGSTDELLSCEHPYVLSIVMFLSVC